MGKKSSQGGKGKSKQEAPANKRYTSELRWIRNKERAIARDKRIKAKIQASPKKARVRKAREEKALTRAPANGNISRAPITKAL